jgi:hypothetical protein
MSNESAMRALEQHIERVRSIPEALKRAAPDAADALKSEILASTARGEAPDGTKWAPTADGHAPLQHAARELNVGAVGTKIVARLEGVYARHDRGRVRGGIERKILPRELSQPHVDALREVFGKAFLDHMGGA